MNGHIYAYTLLTKYGSLYSRENVKTCFFIFLYTDLEKKNVKLLYI